MRLVTRCPACATTFKVVRDQLRISEGWVRCGRCSEVFDATLDLQETDDEGVPLGTSNGAAPAAPAPQAYRPPQESLLPPSTGLPAMSWPSADLLDLGPGPAPAPVTSAPRDMVDPVPIPSLDDDLDEDDGPREPWLDELMASTQALQTALQSASAAERGSGDLPSRQEPGFTPSLTSPSPIEEAVNAQLQKALRRERIKALRRERAEQKERERAEEAARQVSGVDAQPTTSDVPATTPEPVLPTVPLLEAPSASSSFAVDAEGLPAAATGGLAQVLLAPACLLALAALVLQVAREERDTLVAREPRLRPALQTLCDWTGCELSALRQIGSITIDGASFSREKEGDGYRLIFTLRNGARMPLAMPSIELTLLDTQERALVRRVLAPAQFGAPAVLASGAEHGTSLPLQLTGSEAAGLGPVAGYRLIAFYP